MVTFDLTETFENNTLLKKHLRFLQMGADEYNVTYECRKCDNNWCRIAKERGCFQKCSECNSYRAPCTELSKFHSQYQPID